MKKIVLMTLPYEGGYVNWTNPLGQQIDTVNKFMPLGILSLATNLSQDNDIKIFDTCSENWNIERTIKEIEKENPDILGINAVTRKIYALREVLKSVDVPYITVGGPHVTYYPQQTLEWGADAVFVGGLADLEFNDAVEKEPKGIIHCHTKINQIKYPNRKFVNYDEYYPKDSPLFKAEKRMLLFSSIGCPHKCTFCNVQSKKIQLKDPKVILNEMEYLVSLGANSIHILDDNFNVSNKHVNGILGEMDERDFHMEWSGRGQTRMDYSLLKRFEEHNFKRLHVGIEALDDKMLKFFNKSETVDDVYKLCREVSKYDIDILAYFIVGTPVETREYRRSLPKKIRELGIKYQLINMLFPEPDTQYYKQLLDSGVYKKDYWKEYIENPVPDYEIPYPYGEKVKAEVFEDIQCILDELKE